MTEMYGAVAKSTEAETPLADEVENDLSLLELLKAEAAKELTRIVTYKIEEREGWSADFSTNISLSDYNRYTRSAQGKKKRAQDADAAIFAGMALVEHNTRVLFNGKPVSDSEGELMTFGSEEFLSLFQSDSAVGALRKFMGDGHMISTAGALYKEAGFVEEATPEDPTEA